MNQRNSLLDNSDIFDYENNHAIDSDEDSESDEENLILFYDDENDDSESDNDVQTTQHEDSSIESDWSILVDDIFQPEIIDFSTGNKQVGPNNIPPTCEEPLDFFTLFFTSELICLIVKNTNDYAKNKIENAQLRQYSMWNSWEDVTEVEVRAFLGVILNKFRKIYLKHVHMYLKNIINCIKNCKEILFKNTLYL